MVYYQPFNLCQLNSFVKTVPQESFFLHSDEWVWAFSPTWLRPTFSWVLLFLFTCFCFVSFAWKRIFKFIIILSLRSLFFKFLFLFGRAGSSLLCVGFLSLPGAGVGVATLQLQCVGLSLQWLLLLYSLGSKAHGPRQLWHWRSAVGAHKLSCFACMWDTPRPGVKPVSPALVGGLPTTEPPGKPSFMSWSV